MADKPVTREEKYLAYLTGDYTGEISKPITRKEKYLYELCLKGMGGEISPEEIKAAVNEYLEKNPVKPGATTEQAQQIEQNKTNIALLKEDYNTLFDFNNSFNRWNQNDLIPGILKVADGTIIEDTDSNTCNYLKRTDNYICATVTQDDGITVSGYYQRIAQYDVNKNFIKCSYGGSEPILLDDNCEYVRVSITKSQRNVCVYFNSDGTLVAYTPYYEDSKKIKNDYFPPFKVVTAYSGKKMCSFGDSITAHGTWQDTVKKCTWFIRLAELWCIRLYDFR